MSDAFLSCTNTDCNSCHETEIESLYLDIVQALKESSNVVTTNCKTKGYNIPGWNDVCKDAHSEAREAFLMWCANGKLKHFS